MYEQPSQYSQVKESKKEAIYSRFAHLPNRNEKIICQLAIDSRRKAPTANVVETCTLLADTDWTRGIHFLSIKCTFSR